MNISNAGKPLGLFALIMINVIAVDNLRSLTAGAEYGWGLLFFYLIAALFFFLPVILITAELATGWPNTGGVYIWVREAFGLKVGFLAIWLQWIYNVVWYPTIFTFIAGILAYLIHPNLVNNKAFMVITILVTFWGATLINFLGLKTSGIVSIVGALMGTILPMLLIICLGILWLVHQGISSFGTANLSHFIDFKNIAFFTNILFGLMGIEMSAVHAGDVSNPRRNYPRALLYSASIILLTLIFACLAIVLVIKPHELNLVSGLIDAYAIFFQKFHLLALIPIIALLIIIGSLSGAAAWIIGPARGLWVASEDHHLPYFLTQLNKKNMPIGILLLQGIIVTIICGVFIIMPTVNSSYWVLSNLTAQLALIFYILFFAAAVRLRYKQRHVQRAFKIPGGQVGIWLVSSVGILVCVFAIIVGFFPPKQFTIGRTFIYESILIAGIILFCIPGFLFKTKK